MINNKRLTKHWGDNYVATELNYDFLFSLSKEETEKFNAIIKKLAYYEDLEEQGRLTVQPCKTEEKVPEILLGYSCINCGDFVEPGSYCHTCGEGFDDMYIYN